MVAFDDVRARRVAPLLLGVVVLLAVANAGTLVLREVLGHPYVLERFGAFDLNREQSFGTWLSAAMHALCALLAVAAGLADTRRDGAWRKHWWLLAAVFALMSLDEVVALHEYASRPVRDLLGAGGLLHYAWIVPALLFVAVIVLVQLRWLRHLPPTTARGLVVAGVVFVAGAAGVELAESKLLQTGQDTDLDYRLVSLVQEVMELTGQTLAVRALSLHLVAQRARLTLSWSSPTPLLQRSTAIAAGPSRARAEAAPALDDVRHR